MVETEFHRAALLAASLQLERSEYFLSYRHGRLHRWILTILQTLEIHN
jgi:hypothetical protein